GVVHAAGVAVEAVADYGDIDVDDVAGTQLLVVRDAVTDHMVHRGADGLREAAVAEVGGDRLLVVDDEVVADPVQLLGGHARLDMLPDHVQHVGGKGAGDAHHLLLFGRFDRYRHGV